MPDAFQRDPDSISAWCLCFLPALSTASCLLGGGKYQVFISQNCRLDTASDRVRLTSVCLLEVKPSAECVKENSTGFDFSSRGS